MAEAKCSRTKPLPRRNYETLSDIKVGGLELNNLQLYKNSPFFELKSKDGSSSFRVYTINYQFPNVEYGLEADWLQSFIFISVDGMKIEKEDPFIEGVILQKHLHELEEFYDGNLDSVHTMFSEPIFNFSLIKESTDITKSIGNFSYYNHRTRTKIMSEFEYAIDLSNVKELINGIKHVLEKFPPRNDW